MASVYSEYYERFRLLIITEKDLDEAGASS